MRAAAIQAANERATWRIPPHCGSSPSSQPEENAMPYVNIQITNGATRAQKARIVEEVTKTLVVVLGKKPEHTHIVIQEIAEENWGYAGLLTDDWRRQEAERARRDGGSDAAR
jgi:4-oxalocrotonate tautomerase